jgi:prepilin-type processing-associated H-X9-DG protein
MAVLVALAVPVGLLVHSRAGAMMDSQLAAAAVAQALATLPRAVAPVAMPAPGRPATGDEKEALVKLTGQFRDLLRERKLEGAWELIHPATLGQWTPKEWADAQGELLDKALPEGSDNSGMPGIMPLMMAASRLSVADVKTAGTVGVARLAIEVDYPLAMAFRRSGDGWAIDLARCEQLQAKTAIESQVDSASNQDIGTRMWSMILASEGTPFDETVADLIAPPGQGLKRVCESVTVDGDEAVAQFRVKGSLYLDMGVERKGASWKLNWEGPMKVVGIDAPLDPLAGGPKAGSRSQQMSCMSNMKQLALGVLMYCQDYDEQFPIADRWCETTMPYIKNESCYTCPSDDAPWSYAINYKLSRQALGKVESPAYTVMLFETEPSRKNAYDKGAQPGDSMALPPRHGEVSNFAWTDGHVTAQKPADVGSEMYRLSGPRNSLSGAFEVTPGPGMTPPPPPPPPAPMGVSSG